MAAAAAIVALASSQHQQQQHLRLHQFRLPSIPSQASLSIHRSATAAIGFSTASCSEPIAIRIPSLPNPLVTAAVIMVTAAGAGAVMVVGIEAMERRIGGRYSLLRRRRSVESLPSDLAAAVEAGRIPGAIVERFAELEKLALFHWLMQFGGFKEGLLADDLFLAKVAMECGVGIFTKTAAEWERRRENFVKELDFVIADVVMAIVADFMLVWLPAPTVSLKPSLGISARPLSKFFYGCPDNAFKVALAGTSYSFLQRIGAVVHNRSKLFVVGTSASFELG